MESAVPFPPPPPPTHKDRKTGLVVFGILTVLGGLFWLLMMSLMLAGLLLAKEKTADLPSNAMLLPVIVAYGGLAVVLIWLGIGSILARRWARALLLLLSWTILVFGIIGLISLALMAPTISASMQQAAAKNGTAMPPGAETTMLVVLLGVFALFLLGLPLIWIWFYGSRNVRLTCEARDPVERWTDRCPLPLLGAALWAGLSGVCLLGLGFFKLPIFPLFGLFVTGWLARVGIAAVGLLWLFGAVSLFRRKIAGWWMVLITLCLFSVSGFITYRLHDITEIYQRMGYSAEMLEQLRAIRWLRPEMMAWNSLLFAVPFLLYLAYIRRFLERSNGVRA